MNLPTRRTLVLGIGVLLILVTAFLVGYVLQGSKSVGVTENERPFSPSVSPTTQRRPVPGSDEFSVQSYIQPLENNATGSIYSPKAQIRGTVTSWGEGTVKVKVVDKELEISLPETVEFKCFPITKTASDGSVYKMSEVFIDLKNSQGTMADSGSLAEKIPVGSDITVRTDVQEDDSMTANFIVGYGCSI